MADKARERILGTYLRPAKDEAEKVERGMFLNRARDQRKEIEQQFRDVEYWNRVHPNEEPLDPDPDGLLRQMADELDEFITANSEAQ